MNRSIFGKHADAHARILVNLGCGPNVEPSRWTDIDGSWNLRIQTSWWGRPFSDLLAGRSGYRWPSHVKWMDITKGLPFADASVDAVYASHVLEHLYREDAIGLLSECHRILKPEGVIRLVLPDLRHMAFRYLSDDHPESALRFNIDLLMRETYAPAGWIGKLKHLLADHHSHKFMYDQPLLKCDLEMAGFREADQQYYLESRISEIPDVERPGRVLYGAGFIVEAIK